MRSEGDVRVNQNTYMGQFSEGVSAPMVASPPLNGSTAMALLAEVRVRFKTLQDQRGHVANALKTIDDELSLISEMTREVDMPKATVAR